MDVTKLDSLEWEDWSGVSVITDDKKKRWIRQCIEQLERNPDLRETSVLGGDTMIAVFKRNSGPGQIQYEVMEFQPRRVADVFENQPESPIDLVQNCIIEPDELK
jgi:hypothetical protein